MYFHLKLILSLHNSVCNFKERGVSVSHVEILKTFEGMLVCGTWRVLGATALQLSQYRAGGMVTLSRKDIKVFTPKDV